MFSSSSSPVILLISGRFSGAEALPNTTLLTLVEESSKKQKYTSGHSNTTHNKHTVVKVSTVGHTH